MNHTPSHQWPQRIALLANEIQAMPPGLPVDHLTGELWLILRAGLLTQLRREGPALSEHSHEVFEDIASEKALDLLRRIESSEWSLETRFPGEIVNYLRRVAKNALVDRLRRQGKKVISMSEYEGTATEISDPQDPYAFSESRAIGRESALSLRSCVEGLQVRARRVWYLRVFLGLPSKEIALHPDVKLEPGNVDVMLQRARERISTCMERKGFIAGEMPTGSFSEMWLAMQEWDSADFGTASESGAHRESWPQPGRSSHE